MANHIGRDGIVKVGANTVAEVTSFSVSVTANTVDDTVLGDTWATHQAGINSWSGSVSGFWDETDTNGQVALTIGASVTLNLYPEGATSGDTYFSGTATVTGIERSVANNDSIVTVNFTFVGSGALTISVVA